MPDNVDRDYLDKTLQQFESHPYPNIPIEKSPKDNVKLLYEGSLTTASYRRDGTVITDFKDRVMLDVACGTGATTLTMALAHPGAKIIGVDISPESIKVAKERLAYHGFYDVDFHVLAIENLDNLGIKFDYISAFDVLYLLPDLGEALSHLAQVLKPDGIIRGNVHNYYQRLPYYRCQELFRNMGLMDDNPGEPEMGIVREFFDALNDQVDLKIRAWGKNVDKSRDSTLLSNHLLINDKGFTVPQLLGHLERAELCLYGMVDWRDWDWCKLFKEPDNLPAYLAIGLEEASLEEKLCFCELIQPNKRLLDFWCGHPQKGENGTEDWAGKEDTRILVHLHPCVKTEALHSDLMLSGTVAPIDLGRYFPFVKKGLWSDRVLDSCLLLALWDGPQTLTNLIERWQKLSPVDPTTLEPREKEASAAIVRQAVALYEELGILLLKV